MVLQRSRYRDDTGVIKLDSSQGLISLQRLTRLERAPGLLLSAARLSMAPTDSDAAQGGSFSLRQVDRPVVNRKRKMRRKLSPHPTSNDFVLRPYVMKVLLSIVKPGIRSVAHIQRAEGIGNTMQNPLLKGSVLWFLL